MIMKKKLCKQGMTSFYQHSYFPRTIKDWNNLPVFIIESENIDTFTNHLLSI